MTTGCVLVERGWRVREDVRAKKERLNPSRAQHRDLRKSKGQFGRADEWRMSSVIIAAGCDQRNRTIVIGAVCISMDAAVQLRRAA